MRILVTGGAGFIGSHVVDGLLTLGHQVRVVDRLHPRAHAGRPDYLREEVEYLEADLGGTAVDAALDGVEAVCHQAAMVGLGRDFADAPAYVRDNDLATAVLLAALHRRRGQVGRLVLGSSMVIYGEGGYRCRAHGPVRPASRLAADLRAGRFEPGCPQCGGALDPVAVTEETPPDPRSVYAATKLHQEHLCLASEREGGPAVTVLRYHNVYGPRMPRDTPYAGVAAIFRSALEGGRAPRVFEDGGQQRDFVHVTDVAEANLRALLADPPESSLRAYNIASGHPHTVGDMARALADAFGGPEPQVTGDYRIGDVRHVVASPLRAEKELGFRARVGFDDGMRAFATDPLRPAP
jgi:dTDP-L-rhamnose 4-epimerase